MASTTKSAPAKATKSTKPAAVKVEKVLNMPQTWILRTLSKVKSGGLTRREIAERAGKAGCSVSNGRISDEAGNYGALTEKKFVSEHELSADDTQGRAETRYAITAAGKKALAEHGVKAK